MSRSLRSDLALDALEQALHTRPRSDKSSIRATAAPSTRPFAIPSVSPLRASSARSVASATRTTTRSPRPSTVCTRPRSSGAAARGATSTTSSTRRSSGSTGSTTVACSNRSATCHPRSSKRRTINSRVRRWLPDSTQQPSGKTGAVQPTAGRCCDRPRSMSARSAAPGTSPAGTQIARRRRLSSCLRAQTPPTAEFTYDGIRIRGLPARLACREPESLRSAWASRLPSFLGASRP